MCSCSYLGSPCAAECAIPARPRCGVAYVSRPRGGVAHVSTASPRDEVALSSRGARSRAHPRSARCRGMTHAHHPRAAPARGPRGGGFEARGASCSQRLRSSRREAPRRGRMCSRLPRRSGSPGGTPARPCANAFFFNVWISRGEFCGGVERSPVGAPTRHLPRCTARTSRRFRQRRVVHQSSCMLVALTHSNLVWSILSLALSILPPA